MRIRPIRPEEGLRSDATGKPTGIIQDAGGVAFVAAKIPCRTEKSGLENTRKLVADLNAMGLTAWLDAGGRGMSAEHYESYRYLAEHGELNARVFWTTIRQPANADQADKVLAEIPQQKPFQGNDYFDNVGWGETVYAPVTTQLLRAESNTKPEDLAQMRRVALALADRGLYVNSHVEMTAAIDAFLTGTRRSTRSGRSRDCAGRSRTSTRSTRRSFERMKRLGMSAQIHSRPLIQGALMHKVHGDKRLGDAAVPAGAGQLASTGG